MRDPEFVCDFALSLLIDQYPQHHLQLWAGQCGDKQVVQLFVRSEFESRRARVNKICPLACVFMQQAVSTTLTAL